MSHFAFVPNIVDGKGIVENVIVIEQDQIDTGLWGNPSAWIKTSYNTRGGIHYAADSNTPDGGVVLRANYAGIGFTYDQVNDVFYPPQPYPSWKISSPNWTWTTPVALPADSGTGTPPKLYVWDEPSLSWIIPTPLVTTNNGQST